MLIAFAAAPQAEPGPEPQRTADVTRLECVAPDAVEIELHSADLFPVRNALLELQIGETVTSSLSRYGADSELYTVIFTLTRAQLAHISDADVAYVRYDPDPPEAAWLVGAIDAGSATGC